jgi:hypothetical protein
VTAEDVFLWKDKVDQFGGTKLDAVVNIILLDDYFDKEQFQRDKLKAAIGTGKEESAFLAGCRRTRLMLDGMVAPPTAMANQQITRPVKGVIRPARTAPLRGTGVKVMFSSRRRPSDGGEVKNKQFRTDSSYPDSHCSRFWATNSSSARCG